MFVLLRGWEGDVRGWIVGTDWGVSHGHCLGFCDPSPTLNWVLSKNIGAVCSKQSDRCVRRGDTDSTRLHMHVGTVEKALCRGLEERIVQSRPSSCTPARRWENTTVCPTLSRAQTAFHVAE